MEQFSKPEHCKFFYGKCGRKARLAARFTGNVSLHARVFHIKLILIFKTLIILKCLKEIVSLTSRARCVRLAKIG